MMNFKNNDLFKTDINLFFERLFRIAKLNWKDDCFIKMN